MKHHLSQKQLANYGLGGICCAALLVLSFRFHFNVLLWASFIICVVAFLVVRWNMFNTIDEPTGYLRFCYQILIVAGLGIIVASIFGIIFSLIAG